MGTIKLLATLQHIDSDLDAARRQFAQNKAAMEPPPRLKKLAAQVKAAEAQLEQWRRTRKTREDAVAAQHAKIQAEEERLYSGRIKDPREQIALQQHVESLKRHLDTLEDQAWEALMEQEQAQTTWEALRQRFTAEKAAWLEQRQALEKEQARLVEQARALKARRETIVKQLPQAELARYERLRQKLGGVAVVALDGRSCGGCGASLPTSVVQSIQAGEMVRCPICGRWIYKASSSS